MSDFAVGDLVKVEPQFAPYGGQLGVVMLVAHDPDETVVLWPLGGRADHRLAYLPDEIRHVCLGGVPLNVGRPAA